MEKLLTIKEVSEILSVTKDTLRRWHKAGQLIPVVLPGGHRRYKKCDIEKLIENVQ